MAVWIVWGLTGLMALALILILVYTARERSWQERVFGEGIPEEPRGAELLYERNAYYFGTTVGASSLRRYMLNGMSARGNGELWLTTNGILFKRLFEADPFRIPLSWVLRIEEGTGHAGKWAMGRKVIKVVWNKKGGMLISGFLVPASEHHRWLGQMRKEVSRRAPTRTR